MKQFFIKKQAVFTLVFTVVFVLLSQLVIAQAKTDSFEFKRKWWGYAWIKYNGKAVIQMEEFRTIMKPDPVASGYLLKSKQKSEIGAIISIPALICLIAAEANFSSTTSKGKFIYYSGLCVGVGLEAVAYTFEFSANRDFTRAIKKYNSDLGITGYHERKSQLYFCYTGSAMGVGLRF